MNILRVIDVNLFFFLFKILTKSIGKCFLVIAARNKYVVIHATVNRMARFLHSQFSFKRVSYKSIRSWIRRTRDGSREIAMAHIRRTVKSNFTRMQREGRDWIVRE